MPDLSAIAAYAEAFAVAGVPVTINRVSGYTPNVTIVATATVNAIVRNVQVNSTAAAESNFGASEPGAISQNERLVIVSATDLASADYPLPVQKGDQIVLPATNEILTISRVDPYKRAMANAIELYAAGVS